MPKGGRPASWGSNWPDVVNDWMAYGWTPAFLPRTQPTAAQISRMDVVLEWLHLLTRDQRKVIWARANGWTWRMIMALDDDERDGHGRQERALRTILGDAEARILSHLNGTPKRMVVTL
jgi:hypothetical protein